MDIKTCKECPHFRQVHVKHWMLPDGGWKYTCAKEMRCIEPSDGIRPPPTWCPLRGDSS